jgi:hypothetical protein
MINIGASFLFRLCSDLAALLMREVLVTGSIVFLADFEASGAGADPVTVRYENQMEQIPAIPTHCNLLSPPRLVGESQGGTSTTLAIRSPEAPADQLRPRELSDYSRKSLLLHRPLQHPHS